MAYEREDSPVFCWHIPLSRKPRNFEKKCLLSTFASFFAYFFFSPSRTLSNKAERLLFLVIGTSIEGYKITMKYKLTRKLRYAQMARKRINIAGTFVKLER